jgi:hypothetical protein
MIYQKLGHVPDMGPSHEIMDLSRVYVDGFIAGFDLVQNKAFASYEPPEFHQGYQDGHAAYVAVSEKYINVLSYWDVV